jgi:hypothetical protein
MMLADPEDVEADLFGELDFLEQVAHAPGSVLVVQFRKGVDPDLHQLTLAALMRVARWESVAA